MRDDLRECPLKEMISDDEIDAVFANTNFGKNAKPRDIVAETVLKIAGGYHSGHTSMMCVQELGLIGKSIHEPRLTKKGQRYLYWSHKTRPPVTSLVEALRKIGQEADWCNNKKIKSMCESAIFAYEFLSSGQSE